LSQAQLLENVKRLVDSREADCRVDRLDFPVDSLSGGVISTAECEPANCYPL